MAGYLLLKDSNVNLLSLSSKVALLSIGSKAGGEAMA
jgi:hypothetical protein